MKPSPNILRACVAAAFPLAALVLYGLGSAGVAKEQGHVRLLLQPQATPEVRDVRWRKVGSLLTAIHQEYLEHARSRQQAPFDPRIPGLQVRDDRVLIDAVADGDVEVMVASLEDLGAVGISRFKRVVSARLPLAAIPELADMAGLRFARPATAATRVGLTTSQGDAAMMTDLARQMLGVDGTGVTVGVMSDSFDCLGGMAAGVASGDLPSGIVIFDDGACPATDEARAMAEIVHDVAPGAAISAHTASGGQADFALGIQELAGCPPGSEPGCVAVITSTAQVIVDDVGYFGEPFFDDGIIAQAVDSVVSSGVSYFSAAGNSARASYEGPWVPSGPITATLPVQHDFDPGSGVDTFQKVTLPEGKTHFSLQWDSPYFSISGPPGSPNDLDLCLYAEPPGPTPLGCLTSDSRGGDPIIVYFIDVTGGPATANFTIEHVAGPAPGYLKWVGFDSRVVIEEHDTASSTLVGHPNAQGAIAIGASYYQETPAFGVDPALLEPFSSAGGTPVFASKHLTVTNPGFITRDKPELIGPDGVNTTFFFEGVDHESDNFPNFDGTSGAAPHAAGVAALARSYPVAATTTISPWGIRDILESSALDMGEPGFDYDSGWGLIDGKSAIDAVNPGSTTCGPRVLILDSGPPGGGTFNAQEEIWISTAMTTTAVVRSPRTVLQNGAIIDTVAFTTCR